ncbi:MAG: hypothetical protein IT437_03195 [Phycisphaerales bacterium]|nr:hypothetical protein [Phycisphaerales bacterium]
MIDTRNRSQPDQDFQHHMSEVAPSLAQAEASPSLDTVFELEEHLLALRELAETHRDLVRPRLGELRDARQRLEKIKAPLAAALVDELSRVRQDLAEVVHREGVLREAVVWLSRSTGQGTLAGGDAKAEVRVDVRRAVPKSGTPGRVELERAVRASHVWDRVSILHGPRLESQLRRADFPAAARAAIEPLCPRRAVATVKTKSA